MKSLPRTFASVSLLILAAAVSRLIPHWPNFTPILGMSLFGGYMLGRGWKSYIVPLTALAISDVAMGIILGWDYAFHATQWMVYLTVIAITFIGAAFQPGQTTHRLSSALKMTFIGGTIAGVLFFLTTNFAVWMLGGLYPLTLQGLLQCYAAGLAFYRDGGNFFLNGIASTWLTLGALLAVQFIIEKTIISNQILSFGNKHKPFAR
ncbi:MAG: hypothetical protein HYX66_02405 [Ignavibacteria bacterium]|nr:hypothetical protein [Ignavibacteria bacterium]